MKQANLAFWRYVKCSCGQSVTWLEYLEDHCEQHDRLLRAIAVQLVPRVSDFGVYHMTELKNPRKAYYDRLYDWEEEIKAGVKFFVGKAVHDKIQREFPKSDTEIFVQKRVDDFKIIGGIDVIDREKGAMLELKTYATTKFLVDREEAEKDHVFQLTGYWTLLKEVNPTRPIGILKSPFYFFRLVLNRFCLERSKSVVSQSKKLEMDFHTRVIPSRSVGVNAGFFSLSLRGQLGRSVRSL